MTQRSITDLIAAMGGLLVWAGHFAILYGAQTTFCTLSHSSSSATTLRIFGLALTVAAVMALVALARPLSLRARQSGNREDAQSAHFLRTVGLAMTGIGLLAMVWAMLPLLLLSPCRSAAV